MARLYPFSILLLLVCLAAIAYAERINWKINLGGEAVDGFEAEEAVLNVDENLAKMRYHGSIKGSGVDLNVFKTQRFSRGEDLVLQFPVPDGIYSVTLMFAETWKGAFGAGNRVFDVYLGSKPGGIIKVVEAMDPFRSGGPAGPVRRTFDSIATNGGLTLALRPIKQNPQIAGISITGYSYGGSYIDMLPTAQAGPGEGEDFSVLSTMGPKPPADSQLIYDAALNPKFKGSNDQTPVQSSTQGFATKVQTMPFAPTGTISPAGTTTSFPSFQTAELEANGVSSAAGSSSPLTANPYAVVPRQASTPSSVSNNFGVTGGAPAPVSVLQGGVPPLGFHRRLSSYFGEGAPVTFAGAGGDDAANSPVSPDQIPINYAQGMLQPDQRLETNQAPIQPMVYTQGQQPDAQRNILNDGANLYAGEQPPPSGDADPMSLNVNTQQGQGVEQGQFYPAVNSNPQPHMLSPPNADRALSQYADTVSSLPVEVAQPGSAATSAGFPQTQFEERTSRDAGPYEASSPTSLEPREEKTLSPDTYQGMPQNPQVRNVEPQAMAMPQMNSDGNALPLSSLQSSELGQERPTQGVLSGIRKQIHSLMGHGVHGRENEGQNLQFAATGSKQEHYLLDKSNGGIQDQLRRDLSNVDRASSYPSTLDERSERGVVGSNLGVQSDASSLPPREVRQEGGLRLSEMQLDSNNGDMNRYNDIRGDGSRQHLSMYGKSSNDVISRNSDFGMPRTSIRGLSQEVQNSEGVSGSSSYAGVHIGNGHVDGICIDNMTHCSCGAVDAAAPQECLYVSRENVDPMLCVRRPCSGRLICACAAGANSLCARSTVKDILVLNGVQEQVIFEGADEIACHREKLENEVGILTRVK